MSTSSARYKPTGGGGIQPRYDPYSVPHQPYNGSSSTAAKYQQSARHLRRQPTATISVGGDDWANQVINNVVGSLNHAPGDYYSSDINNDTHHSQSEVDAAVVQEKIAEKKRKFHADRTLELKNLPDGATEQVIKIFFNIWNSFDYYLGVSGTFFPKNYFLGGVTSFISPDKGINPNVKE